MGMVSSGPNQHSASVDLALSASLWKGKKWDTVATTCSRGITDLHQSIIGIVSQDFG